MGATQISPVGLPAELAAQKASQQQQSRAEQRQAAGLRNRRRRCRRYVRIEARTEKEAAETDVKSGKFKALSQRDSRNAVASGLSLRQQRTTNE